MATKIYTPQIKQEALQLYFQGTRLPDIARELRVPYGTVHNWHTSQGWTSIRRQMQAELMDDWKRKVLAAMKISTMGTWARHLVLCQKISDVIQVYIESNKETISPKEILEVCRAFKTEYAVFHRLFSHVFPQPAISE
jgi:transposase-like protein